MIEDENRPAVGFPVSGWQPCHPPARSVMSGRYCRLEPLNINHHAQDLYQAYQASADGRIWTYLTSGPFDDFEAYQS